MNVPPSSCYYAINNHGASLVQSGYYKEAISVLTTGLKFVRKEMATKEEVGEGSEALLPNSSSKQCSHRVPYIDSISGAQDLSLAPRQQSSLERQCAHTNRNISATEFLHSLVFEKISHQKKKKDDGSHGDDMEQEPFLFTLPIFLHRPGNSSLTTASFLMIFNMALSYDLIARSEHEQGKLIQENDMRIALKLYELAFRLQEGDIDSEISSLYPCGLLNNMARLYNYFQNSDEANWCLSYLLGILMCYKVQSQYFGRTVQGTNQMEFYYLSEFFRSTSVMVLKDPGTAEAA